ncbi:hypothetical protein [Anoxybacter fermentans]|uniref:hypothetical protein n=1 Tax=Anoxybacter fermentans TaxID=1323375 RepID=UPI003AB7A3F9
MKFPAVFTPISGFGASDCSCPAHLFYFIYRPNMENLLYMIKEETGLTCKLVL